MAKKEKEGDKHHYIPKFYLKQWAAPSLIPSFQMTSKSPLNDRHFDTVSAKRAIRGNSL
jgi:hypothetical protein